VTNTGLLPCFIFFFGFVSLNYIVSVHLFSSLLKSSASVFISDGTYGEIFRKEQNLTDGVPITKDI